MRIDLQKVLFFGLPKEMHRFFSKAQQLGILQFIDPNNKTLGLPEQLKVYLDAIKILKTHFTAKEQAQPQNKQPYEMALEITKLQQQKHELEQRKRQLQAEIARIGPFGDFSLEDAKYIREKTGIQLQFFCSRKKLEDHDLPLVYIGTEYDLYYYIALSSRRVARKGLISIEINASLSQMQSEWKDAEEKIHEIEKVLIAHNCYYQFIYHGMLSHLNDFHLEQAKNSVSMPIEDHLFYIFAYVPKNKIKQLQELLKPFHIDCQLAELTKKDRLPTYLENKGTAKMGEDLIGLYDPPGNQDQDPSLWVVLSFTVFFAIILSDAGYGLILLLISFFLMKKFRKAKAKLKRFAKLCVLLSSGVIVWGVLTSSFFGINFPINSKIEQFSFIEQLVQKKVKYHKQNNDLAFQDWAKRFPVIKQLSNPKEILNAARIEQLGKVKYVMQEEFQRDILLEIAILIGIIHVILSMLRYCGRNFSSIGWIFAIIGGYLFFPSIIKATTLMNFFFGLPSAVATNIGYYFLFGGIFAACIIALIQKRLGGLAEITESIQIFADILSYLRLYALALAGMVMASTFNDLGLQAGPIFGPVIILSGHIINLSMAIMSGVIHGLRLNFIEWYHYSFDGGGKMFKPLTIIQ